jgi:hypothetical protein
MATSLILGGLSVPAMAGFTASTGTDFFTYTAPGSALLPAAGGSYHVSNQPLATYTPDTAADPQIVPGDVDNFLFSLDLGITSVNGSTGAVSTNGTYSLFYDLGDNGTPDIRVSAGTASLFLTPVIGGFNVATGQLMQVDGPANPAFSDLAYGDNDNLVLQGGFIDATNGTFALTLRQNVVVPEPASLGLISGGLLALRRRRA